MNIVVDRGNTRTKIAFFNSENQMINLCKYDNHTFDLYKELQSYENHQMIVSSVAKDYLPKKESVLCLTANTPLPIQNAYKSDTVGVDRLALAVGVNTLSPNTNSLIFDFGSAITIDFMNAENIFMGGNISPGMGVRFAALHEKTGKLPLMSAKDWQYHLFADNTKDAICGGVIQGVIFEIEGYISRYEKKYPNLKIFFTGGDAIFFAKQIKKSIFADENLVLIGLNRILNYNA